MQGHCSEASLPLVIDNDVSSCVGAIFDSNFFYLFSAKTAFKPCVRPISLTSTNTPSPDNSFEEARIKKGPGDENNRAFTYFMLGNTRFIYASTARLILMKVTKHKPHFLNI